MSPSGSARPPFPLATVLIVALGSGLGAVARHAVELALVDQAASLMLINLTGSLALGLLVGLIDPDRQRPSSPARRGFVLLGPGFLGGYTTFSTVMVAVIMAGSWHWVLLLGLQLLAGAMLALVGLRLGRLVRS